jgi:hypothetical protein
MGKIHTETAVTIETNWEEAALIAFNSGEAM